jgi:hypothetical protein
MIKVMTVKMIEQLCVAPDSGWRKRYVLVQGHLTRPNVEK